MAKDSTPILTVMSQNQEAVKAPQPHQSEPSMSTLSFIKQFARCYHFEKRVKDPRAASLILN